MLAKVAIFGWEPPVLPRVRIALVMAATIFASASVVAEFGEGLAEDFVLGAEDVV
jgi:hypothetical protein